MNKLKQIWSNLRSIFWFVPSLIVAFSIAFVVALVEAGSIGSDQWLARWPLLFGASAGRRRALRDQVRWIAELADHTLDSVYDRARIDARLALV